MNSDFNNKNVLIIGASSDLAQGISAIAADTAHCCGLHYNKNIAPLLKYKENTNVLLLKKNLSKQEDCASVVDDFIAFAGGIDYLIILSGGCKEPVHWEDLNYEHLLFDFNINAFVPFFIAQRAIRTMKYSGGKIIFTVTSSSKRGGGANSLGYGASKYALECITMRLAKDCAKYNIFVNAIAPGYINTKFHTDTMKRDEEAMKKRNEFVPFKRPGEIHDFTNAALFLLDEKTTFVSGHILNVDGADFV